MVFIEPTPYILDLLERGFVDIGNNSEVVFLTENLSQNWNLQSHSNVYCVIQSKKQILSLLRDIFLKRKYRLMHVAGWSHPFVLFLIIASRLFHLPLVVESDTPLDIMASSWKTIIKKFLYPILFKFPVFFLPGGTRQARYLAYYGVKSEKIMNAQMTVDVDKIKSIVNAISISEQEKLRLQYGAEKDDVIFLFVGRLLDWKGIRELLSAIASISDQRGKLWIVGAGKLENEVILAAQKCKKITYFGRISGDFLWQIYCAANVFVLPSHAEPWGLVVNEAMAAGLPVIVTKNVGCVDDLVLENDTGIVIEPNNSIALSQVMNDMLQNPEKRKLLAKNASDHIANWTLQNEARNIMTAWKNCTRGRSNNVCT